MRLSTAGRKPHGQHTFPLMISVNLYCHIEVEELHLLDDRILKLEKFHSEKMHGMNRCEAYRNSPLRLAERQPVTIVAT